jgi:ferredoxin
MMQAVTRILGEIGVPSDQVKTETFLGPEPTPPPHTGGPVSAPPAPGLAVPVCSFVRSGKTAPLPADKTVLEASEDVGVNIEYSCRQGYCGVCKTKLLSGQVAMAVEDGLSLEDKAAQLILACQAKAATDIAVEA